MNEVERIEATRDFVGAFSSLLGHAGAVVRHPDGRTEAASDPRADGFAWAR